MIGSLLGFKRDNLVGTFGKVLGSDSGNSRFGSLMGSISEFLILNRLCVMGEGRLQLEKCIGNCEGFEDKNVRDNKGEPSELTSLSDYFTILRFIGLSPAPGKLLSTPE